MEILFLIKRIKTLKSDRQKRRSLLSRRRRLTSNGVVTGLILANAAVFVLWKYSDKKFMLNNFTLLLDNFKNRRFHTMITYAFSHSDISHLATNMFALIFFGTSVGRHFGPGFLLKLYLVAAFTGSIFYLVYETFFDKPFKIPDRPVVYGPSKCGAKGASAATHAIMLLDVFLLCPEYMLLGILSIGYDMMYLIQGNTNAQVMGTVAATHMGGHVVGTPGAALMRNWLV